MSLSYAFWGGQEGYWGEVSDCDPAFWGNVEKNPVRNFLGAINKIFHQSIGGERWYVT